MLQCALEFAQHGPVSVDPSTDSRLADSSMEHGPVSGDPSTDSRLADSSMVAMSLNSQFTPAVGMMDVDMGSPHSLNRFEKIQHTPPVKNWKILLEQNFTAHISLHTSKLGI